MDPMQNEKEDKEEGPVVKDLQMNWEHLRKLSLMAGGFGEDRTRAWSYLLHTQNCEEKAGKNGSLSPLAIRQRKKHNPKTLGQSMTEGNEKVELRPPSPEQHPDEHQIKLDTDRSFVLYPVGNSDREELQEDLNALITAIFRSHPALSYFQGYHDIITVLFLTLPDEYQQRCAERMSLHRLRDAMGKGLEPLIGLLRILKYLLRLADPDYAALLERNTPLPYFALSNLLTLFSHDVPTLPLIQHVFDYLLSRPPIASVYLAAAITIARKDEAYKMEEEGEDGMLHSLLSTLPELTDENKDMVLKDGLEVIERSVGDEKVAGRTREENGSAFTDEEISQLKDLGAGETLHGSPSHEGDEGVQGKTPPDQVLGENSDDELVQRFEVPVENASQQAGSSACEGSDRRLNLDTSTSLSPETDDHSSGALLLSSSTVSPPASPISQPSDFSQQRRKRRAAVSLPVLLTHADVLYEQFPPTHPSLHLSEIIGPKSVIFTWSEDPAQLLSDAEAEALIAHPELIILPYQDPDELPIMKEGGDSDQYDSDVPPKKGRRKLRKRRRRGDPHFGVALDRKTVLTGAVVALGVAVAVYSVRSRNGHGPFDIARADREWRRAGRWVSGVVIGGSEKLLKTFGW